MLSTACPQVRRPLSQNHCRAPGRARRSPSDSAPLPCDRWRPSSSPCRGDPRRDVGEPARPHPPARHDYGYEEALCHDLCRTEVSRGFISCIQRAPLQRPAVALAKACQLQALVRAQSSSRLLPLNSGNGIQASLAAMALAATQSDRGSTGARHSCRNFISCHSPRRPPSRHCLPACRNSQTGYKNPLESQRRIRESRNSLEWH